MLDQDNVLIGVITGAHGLNGEVNVKTFTAEPMNIMNYGEIKLGDNRILPITKARGAKKANIIVRFKQIADRNAAEALRGQELFVCKNQLPAVTENEFLHIDLIGLTVRAINAECEQNIGVLRSIQNYGAGDIMDISTHEGPDLMAPFNESAVKNIDLEKKIIMIDGLFLI